MSTFIDGIPQDEFATDEFIADNSYFYDKYIEARIHGYSPHAAFNRSFGAQHWPDSFAAGYNRCEQMESTEYYKAEFERRLTSMSVDKLWNDKTAVHELLMLVRNPINKDSTRLAAAKELNILVGITIESESGKTKAVRALSDFYSDNTKPETNTSTQDNTSATEGAAEATDPK